MKLLRYGSAGRERPALLDSAGTIRDLGGREGYRWRNARAGMLATLAALDPTELPPCRLACASAPAWVASGSSSASG